MGADRAVERHLGRRVREHPAELAQPLERLAHARERPIRVLDRPLDPFEEPERGACQPLDTACGERRPGGLRIGDPAIDRLRRLGHRLEVEEHGGDVNPRHAIDHSVVGLGEEGEALAGQPLPGASLIGYMNLNAPWHP